MNSPFFEKCLIPMMSGSILQFQKSEPKKVLCALQLITPVKWKQSFPEWFRLRGAFLLAPVLWPTIKLSNGK